MILLHLCCSPYTKVEESFNIQAVHDMMRYGVRPAQVPKYDHVSFPGSVPRSFIGALVLAGMSSPFGDYVSSYNLQLVGASIFPHAVLLGCGQFGSAR